MLKIQRQSKSALLAITCIASVSSGLKGLASFHDSITSDSFLNQLNLRICKNGSSAVAASWWEEISGDHSFRDSDHNRFWNRNIEKVKLVFSLGGTIDWKYLCQKSKIGWGRCRRWRCSRRRCCRRRRRCRRRRGCRCHHFAMICFFNPQVLELNLMLVGEALWLLN